MANSLLTPPPQIDPEKQGPTLRPANAPNLNEETDGSMWSSFFANLRDAFSRSDETPLHLESRPADNDFIIEEEGVFASLLNSVRDVFFPVKLPPLVLESQPIAVVDRMKTKQNPIATTSAVVIYGLIILLIAFLLAKKVQFAAPVRMVQVTDLSVPPQAPPRAQAMGGGGGQRGPTPVTKGTPPKAADTQIVPPSKPPLVEPKIKIDPTVEMQKDIKMATSIPQIGVANSPLVGMSLGNGSGTGLGSGSGSGIGPGSGGNTGGGPKRIGGGVSAPVLIFSVEPEFSEEARKAKVAGNVLVNLWVDTNGNPSHVHVIRGVGMGLDEKAMEAVRQYKFKPAMENGRPVLVELNVEVNFQIF
ncbi:energy transducer TonB [Tunturibacter empetritectus]|uniref:Protein TonB n=1 Tax=Tunturiibacter empetritectus TaxID=3069691 RepID=A0A7W8IF93_9BACT|nr:energy transducer TonB [Edaphobacter lichenicola]MBB5315892.1 protein TonB [Edaphobacter lichenicola]